MMGDNEIRAEWERIRRLYERSLFAYESPNHLGMRLAESYADDLEKAGVTDADIDRLFPQASK